MRWYQCRVHGVYGVMYELSGGRHAKEHRQPEKIYSLKLRVMTEPVWNSYVMGTTEDTGESSQVLCLRPAFLAAAGESALFRRDSIDNESFCSALSNRSSSSGDDLENQAPATVNE